MKEYILKPIMTPATLTRTPIRDKPAVGRPVPPRQPLPTAVMAPAKPLLKLGLDVHLQFIMAVAQKDHAHPHAPRKFTRAELVAQVGQWVQEGFQVFCVDESCGFGFVLHRELVAAGAQSFIITNVAWEAPATWRPQRVSGKQRRSRTLPSNNLANGLCGSNVCSSHLTRDREVVSKVSSTRAFRPWPDHQERREFAEKVGVKISELINEILRDTLKPRLEERVKAVREAVVAPRAVNIGRPHSSNG